MKQPIQFVFTLALIAMPPAMAMKYHLTKE